ncbi:hypothetical protein HMPREF9130_0070 [Peptoniphilus sp. oral taxon 375 str. F0436]|nr:hypothetical protein HMPREF9130_0070 [Peptoniphilus sp. oral taxon 375 str. F0436]
MKKRFISYVKNENAGANISWGAIFAGLAAFMAVFVTLSFIGSALGFGLLDPTSRTPLSGVGTGLAIWTVIALALSAICGGFVSGLASQRIGLLHGFVTWATSVLLVFVLVTYASISAISGIGKAVGDITSTVASGAGSVAESAGSAAKSGVDAIIGDLNIDTEELDGNVKEVLKDTDIKELQPNYLQGQLEAAGNEIKEAAKDIAVNPDQSEQIIQNTTDSLQKRAETIANAADRDAIKNALAKNSDLTPEEADKAVDNIYTGLEKSSKEAEEKINQASNKLTELQVQAEETIEDTREGAKEVTTTTAKASVWTFVGLVLAMVLSSYFGLVGSRLGSDPEVKREA